LAARLLRGAVGGILAGMVFAGVTMWFADSTGGKATMPLHMISTIVKGDKAMAAGTTSVGLGLLVHMVLSALFGMVFALVVPRLRTNGTVALAGTLLSFAFFGPGARRGEPVLAIHGARDTTGGAPGAWSTGR
jgi:putative copper export protein